ncbi:MAG: hypothetical protein F6K31_06750 [Symploca sp. SIO2G7]|nr:hypothetical protein [Symploca sp. SIO2G7]
MYDLLRQKAVKFKVEYFLWNRHPAEYLLWNRHSAEYLLWNRHPAEYLLWNRHPAEYLLWNRHPAEYLLWNRHPACNPKLERCELSLSVGFRCLNPTYKTKAIALSLCPEKFLLLFLI